MLVRTAAALGETFGDLAQMFGRFQRPAALGSGKIVRNLCGLNGPDVAHGPRTGRSFVGYTDPGGDLMLALTFLALAFTPCTDGFAARLGSRQRGSGRTMHGKATASRSPERFRARCSPGSLAPTHGRESGGPAYGDLWSGSDGP